MSAIPIPPVAWSRAGLSGVPRETLAACNVFELARLAAISATTDAGRAFCEAARLALVDLEARMGVDDAPRGADGDVLYPRAAVACSSFCHPSEPCTITADGRYDATGAAVPAAGRV